MTAKDNGSGRAKAAFRRQWAGGVDGACVLDLFAGTGDMYRQIWRRAERGATMDKDPAKAQAAAEERAGWLCCSGDAVRALECGWAGWMRFDVVDIDAWGSPWPFLDALVRGGAALSGAIVLLTDGYAGQKSVAMPCRTLFPGVKERMTLSDTEYVEAAERALATRWGAPEVLDFGRLRGGAGRMYAWALRYAATCQDGSAERGNS